MSATATAAATAMSAVGGCPVVGAKSAHEEVLLGEHYSNTSVYSGTEEDVKGVEHCKRRRVMARWVWAADMSGGNMAAATAMMKGLYAEDHNEMAANVKDGLMNIANELYQINPADGQVNMTGVEASLGTLARAADHGLKAIVKEIKKF